MKKWYVNIWRDDTWIKITWPKALAAGAQPPKVPDTWFVDVAIGEWFEDTFIDNIMAGLEHKYINNDKTHEQPNKNGTLKGGKVSV